MQLREFTFWIRIRESMWFVPTLLVLGGLVLAVTMLYLDTNHAEVIARWVPWTFEGNAEGARVILGTIAGAMATVVGIAFSITIVVLQLAAGQYSPRVITTFRRDRGQQVVLGTYLATFIYALLVVREVRSPLKGNDSFIPGLSMLVALVLAVVSLGMLVYFVHHISEQLRVSDIAGRIYDDLAEMTDELFPETVGEPYDAEETDQKAIDSIRDGGYQVTTIVSGRAGYVQQVDGDDLLEVLEAPVEAVIVCARIGEFVLDAGQLAEVYFHGQLSEERCKAWEKRVRSCLTIGSRPTLAQNPELGIQQLVDIALRALSPGINDPTTAEQVLAQLGNWIGRLAHRSFPSQVRRVDNRVLVLPRPSFEDHVREAFDQIRRVARPHVHVLHSILEVLSKIAATDPPERRLAPIRRQVEAIEHCADEQNIPDPGERQELVDHADRLLDRLGS